MLTKDGWNVQPTRFASLGYLKVTHQAWRIADITDMSSLSVIGPCYRTRAELLADLNRVATERGYN